MPLGTSWIVVGDRRFTMRTSGWVTLEDHQVPHGIELTYEGDGEPTIFLSITVDENGPKLVELRFTSTDPDARGIRQSDLRDLQITLFLEDVVASVTYRMERDSEGRVAAYAPLPGSAFHTDAMRFIGRVRAGRTARDITPQLLERVATVYRENIDRYPTKAVQHHFQVSQRMAAEYVSRARKRGLLPPTKKGKKQA
jgi:hypothetical protein